VTAGGGRPIPRAAWAIAAAAVPVHLALALGTDLSPDEAYYLCAARRAGAIVDHPPLTLGMLAVSDRWMPGPVELRVRVLAIVLSFVTSALIVALAQARGAGRQGAVLAAWAGTWSLLPMAGGFVTTPDTALLPALAVALLVAGWGAEPAPTTPPPPSWRVAVAALAIATAALAKVVAIPVAAVLAVASRGSRLRVAFVVGLALALPWLAPSLRFQLRHAFVSSGAWSAGAALEAIGGAVGAQLAMWSPVVLALGLRAARRRLRRTDLAVLAGLTALVALSACVRGIPPEPNWWAPAALLVVVAFAADAEAITQATRRVVLATVLAPTAIAVAHVLHPFLPLAPAVDPTARLHGWKVGDSAAGAAGVGPYGAASERCVYRGDCIEIESYFEQMTAKAKGGF
jgi:hypothetical protein